MFSAKLLCPTYLLLFSLKTECQRHVFFSCVKNTDAFKIYVAQIPGSKVVTGEQSMQCPMDNAGSFDEAKEGTA